MHVTENEKKLSLCCGSAAVPSPLSFRTELRTWIRDLVPPARDRFGLYDFRSPHGFVQEWVIMAPSKEFDARFAELFGSLLSLCAFLRSVH